MIHVDVLSKAARSNCASGKNKLNAAARQCGVESSRGGPVRSNYLFVNVGKYGFCCPIMSHAELPCCGFVQKLWVMLEVATCLSSNGLWSIRIE